MTDEKESKQPDEHELEPETVADLDVADEDADEVRGGCCANYSLMIKASIGRV